MGSQVGVRSSRLWPVHESNVVGLCIVMGSPQQTEGRQGSSMHLAQAQRQQGPQVS